MEFVIFLLVISISSYIYLSYKNKRREQEQTGTNSNEVSETHAGIKIISFVERGAFTAEPDQITQSAYTALNKIIRVFKYPAFEDYWIEFLIENKTVEDINFVLGEVVVALGGNRVTCNLTLLREQAHHPKFAGYDTYFDTNAYNNYALGKSGQKTFEFQSRFLIEPGYKISAADFIEIKLEFNKLNTDLNKYVTIDEVIFRRSFIYLEFKAIQEMSGTVEWETGSYDE